MKRFDTDLPEVYILEPEVFYDSRGYLLETYNAGKFRELGIEGQFVQDNHSCSSRGTLRGLHYQLRHPQAKLCRVIAGEVLDVAVDIRRGSPTFGQWTSVLLSDENKRQIYIPAGFAHGFLVLSERAEFLYKCDDFYRADDYYAIAWNDPEIGIEWGSREEPLLSPRDQIAPRLSEVGPSCLPMFDGAFSALQPPARETVGLP
jgi:dTDP-4-dehydrorhamnose 3,5-epimerase